MTSGSAISPATLDDDEEPLLSRDREDAASEFDITAMIDLVFMMNIFFLVTSVAAGLIEIDLPSARHCIASDRDTSVVITILPNSERSTALVTIDDLPSDEPLTEPADQERAVKEAVEAGVRDNRTTVLIKAAKGVKLRDVMRIAGAASAVEHTDLKLAVIEKE